MAPGEATKTGSPSSPPRVRLSAAEKARLLGPYVRKRLVDQVKAVSLIVAYLILFQTLVLRIAIAEAALIAAGIAVIILGLAFFMEGLFLGLMPLGETIGIRLPQKAKLPVILAFAFVLGVGVTFAEPAIGILQVAGSFIKAWDAPLLFLLLNKYAMALKVAVGIGVGIAVLAGMLRFWYKWSLKPFLYVGVPLTLALSLWAYFEPNLGYLSGVAWDCGGVTTGPVTVPLVLALGIGVARMTSGDKAETGGFGVVTLASLFPIVTVFALGIAVLGSVPAPLPQEAFFSPANRAKVLNLFDSEDELRGYALRHAGRAGRLALWGGDESAMLGFVAGLAKDEALRARVLGDPDPAVLEAWALASDSPALRLAALGGEEGVAAAAARSASPTAPGAWLGDLLARNGIASAQAVLPLVLFLLLVLLLLLRERLPHPDETLLGVVFALLGMVFFNIGIELGLSRLGNQVGTTLPASFTRIELAGQATRLEGFDPSRVMQALRPDGSTQSFFFADLGDDIVRVPYDESRFDAAASSYTLIPSKGPLFGGGALGGILVVILFAFFMGYGATLAEPALNALGQTVEALTVGALKKSLLMQAVAVGVGVGIAVGVLKIILGIPLIWLLAPPYLLLMVLTRLSTEEFVNIGWDSAGVTTGPITVPLVLAMGLGIGGQVGAVEGFGILASASVFPILSVLAVGLAAGAKKRAVLGAAGAEARG